MKYSLLKTGLKVKDSIINFEVFHYIKFLKDIGRLSLIRDMRRLEALVVKTMPLSYILPNHPFCGTNLAIRSGVLIPRNETEDFVTSLITKIKNYRIDKEKPFRILDLCTGSGCIAIALACNIRLANVIAVDKSSRCCENAKLNIIFNRSKINEMKSTVEIMKNDILTDSLHSFGKFDLIVSNPPYIPYLRRKKVDRNVLKYESHTSLFPSPKDKTGLLFHTRIINISKNLLKESNTNYSGPKIAMEFNGSHQVHNIIKIGTNVNFKKIYFRKDLMRNPRTVWLY